MAIGKLIKSLVKSKSQPAIAPYGEDLRRLTTDGRLPVGWHYANREFTEKINTEYRYFLDNWIENKHESPVTYYGALKSLVLYMYDVQKLCDSKGECFSYWLSDQFSADELAEREAELRYIEEHIDELCLEYQTKKRISEQLPEIIKENPGILQTDLYKRFPEEYKGHISSELYTMAHSGIITREKSGRSYSLKIAR